MLCVLLGTKAHGQAPNEGLIPNPMMMGFSSHALGYETVQGNQAQVAMQRTALVAPLAQIPYDDQSFVPGVALERTLFRLKNSNLDDQAMYQLALPLGLLRMDEQNIRLLSIAPSVHSDGKVLDDAAFSLNVLALWQSGLNRPLGYRWGWVANRTFGRYRAVPVMGIQYRPNPRTELDLGFPFAKAEYSFAHRWNGFVNVTPSGGNWRYQNEAKHAQNLSYSSWLLTAGLRYRTYKRLWFSLELGRSLLRRLELTDDDGQRTESSIRNSHFVLFSFGLHP